MSRVLVVEDELSMRRALDIGLRARGYEVVLAATGEEALARAHDEPPDVVILDLGLPGIDGIRVANSLRSWSKVPIIVLSARGAEAVKVAALDAGADDYVTKPFGMDELLARIRAALRRSGAPGHPLVVTTPHFIVDLAAQRVTRSVSGGAASEESASRQDSSASRQDSADRGDVRLSPTQWHLLEVLVRNAGTLVTQQQLLAEVWGPGHENATHYLRVFIAQLRQKLEPDPAHPLYLRTEPGRGYRFEAGVATRTTLPNLAPAAKRS